MIRLTDLSECGCNAVDSRISTSNHNNVLALRKQLEISERLVIHLLLLPRFEEAHGEVDSLRTATFDGKVTRPRGAHAEQRGVELVHELLG